MTRLLLLGSGELGREVALEAARLGLEVVAADRYDGAPAMLVTPHRRVLDMTDPVALHRAGRARCDPTCVVPEVEALATEALLALEAAGTHVVPTARATRLTMDREGIRRLAAEELGLATSPYRFASSEDEFVPAVAEIGTPVRRQAGDVARAARASRPCGPVTTRSPPGPTPATTRASRGVR